MNLVRNQAITNFLLVTVLIALASEWGVGRVLSCALGAWAVMWIASEVTGG